MCLNKINVAWMQEKYLLYDARTKKKFDDCSKWLSIIKKYIYLYAYIQIISSDMTLFFWM